MRSFIRSIACIALLAFALPLAGCLGNSQGGPSVTKELVGTLLGGALGGWGGSKIGSGSGQLAATAAGALLGAFVGRSTGQSLDRADKLAMQQSLEYGRSGTTQNWYNPDSGNRGSITPGRAYPSRGTNCRPYESSVVIDGRLQVETGTACRNADGTWSTVNDTPQFRQPTSYPPQAYYQPQTYRHQYASPYFNRRSGPGVILSY